MEERWGLYGKAWEWYARARRSESPPAFLLAWTLTSLATLAGAMAIIWLVYQVYGWV